MIVYNRAKKPQKRKYFVFTKKNGLLTLQLENISLYLHRYIKKEAESMLRHMSEALPLKNT